MTEEQNKKRDFNEAFRSMQMTDEEARKLEEEQFQAASFTKKDVETATGEKVASPEPDVAPVEKEKDNSLPEWVEFPPNFKIPPNKQVAFMRFRSKWTDRPDKGDRWCMVWPLSDAEEKLALKRTRGDNARTLSELAKQTIHIVDGKKADWSGTPDPDSVSVERFWNEIGAKCRQQIVNFYVKTHTLQPAEQDDFFANCLVVRTATVG